MAYTVPEILQSRKAHEALLLLSVAVLALLSFGLGRLSAAGGHPVPQLCKTAQLQGFVPIQTNSARTSNDPATSAPMGQATYVASKNGSVYHYPWCPGAQRINEENKVWFATKEEAVKAGYRAATNCKGL